MVTRTIYIGNPARIRKELNQLVVTLKDSGEQKNVPVEDIGVLMLDHPQITITNALLSFLLEHNVAVVNCGENHMPRGMFLPNEGNHQYSGVVRMQLEATKPLKKQLWQQTVQAKIYNQARVLQRYGYPWQKLERYSKAVRTNDKSELEGVAAAHYWQHLFTDDMEVFVRDPNGAPPNNLLNYGYAILRAITARALVSSGLQPLIGIHHKNQYNAFCLADDIMEPYRPYVDMVVKEILEEYQVVALQVLDKELKQRLLQIPVLDVEIDGAKSPLMVAMHRTTSSLVKCFSGEKRNLLFPQIGTL